MFTFFVFLRLENHGLDPDLEIVPKLVNILSIWVVTSKSFSAAFVLLD
jgi:hypothetical protein